jgi:hypothetical protein
VVYGGTVPPVTLVPLQSIVDDRMMIDFRR